MLFPAGHRQDCRSVLRELGVKDLAPDPPHGLQVTGPGIPPADVRVAAGGQDVPAVGEEFQTGDGEVMGQGADRAAVGRVIHVGREVPLDRPGREPLAVVAEREVLHTSAVRCEVP